MDSALESGKNKEHCILSIYYINLYIYIYVCVGLCGCGESLIQSQCPQRFHPSFAVPKSLLLLLAPILHLWHGCGVSTGFHPWPQGQELLDAVDA